MGNLKQTEEKFKCQDASIVGLGNATWCGEHMKIANKRLSCRNLWLRSIARRNNCKNSFGCLCRSRFEVMFVSIFACRGSDFRLGCLGIPCLEIEILAFAPLEINRYVTQPSAAKTWFIYPSCVWNRKSLSCNIQPITGYAQRAAIFFRVSNILVWIKTTLHFERTADRKLVSNVGKKRCWCAI